MVIYKVLNKIDGRVYVGKDTKDRTKYLGSGVYITNAIKKHGKENFEKEVIDVAESMQELNKKEKYWIKFYNCKFPNGYNLTGGGDGVSGYIWTEDDKKKNSISHKICMNKPEVKEKTRVSSTGRFHNEKTRKKISEKTKEGMHRPEIWDKYLQAVKSLDRKIKIRNSSTGRTHSEKAKEKIRRAKTGESNPSKREDVRKKNRDWHKERTFSEETKRRMRESHARRKAGSI